MVLQVIEDIFVVEVEKVEMVEHQMEMRKMMNKLMDKLDLMALVH